MLSQNYYYIMKKVWDDIIKMLHYEKYDVTK